METIEREIIIDLDGNTVTETITNEPELNFNEIEEVLQKEEASDIQPLEKKKRFRTTRENYRYSNEEIDLNNKRYQLRRYENRDKIISLLADNPDYILVDFNRYEELSTYYFDSLNNRIVSNEYLYLNNDLEKCRVECCGTKDKIVKEDKIIPNYLLNTSTNEHTPEKYLLVNIDKLIRSKGKDFYVRYKQGIGYPEIKRLRMSISEQFKSFTSLTETLNNVVSSVYDSDHYDIIYDSRMGSPKTGFTIAVKFDDITITNSIEQSHHIGTIVVYLEGWAYQDRMRIIKQLKALRTSYTVEEAVMGYTHSHLPPGRSLDDFCLGHDNHMFVQLEGQQLVSELELESILIGLQDYIAWESLEGGPHIKMEQITLLPQLSNVEFSVEREANYLYAYQMRTYLAMMLKHYDELSEIFNLVRSGKNYRFSYDENKLFEFVAGCIKEYIEENDNISNLANSYLYNISNHKFFHKNNDITNWNDAVNIAKNKLKDYYPVYFKGETTHPVLTNEESGGDIMFKDMIPMPYGAALTTIANVIMNMLNNEFKKDEYRNKK